MSNLLEREFNSLRSYRVRLRNEMAAIAKAASIDTNKIYGSDGFRARYHRAAVELKATEKRWQELSAMLGRPLPGPAVKLTTLARTRAQQPVRLRATPRRASAPYLTRMLAPGR